MQQRKLPIGIQSLGEIINGGYYYVDKTPFIARLIDQGKYYFLSRPRRFGKSLLLDTIKELFEGNRPLFAGLFIENQWNWKQQHPVIRLDFGDGVVQSRMDLDTRILEQITEVRQRLQLPVSLAKDLVGNFRSLIIAAAEKFNAPVALLIDEYDKPILDNIDNPAIAAEVRDGLKNIYSVLKGTDPYLKFCLLTGVSKFSKVSLFSGLNNLNDITLTKEFSAICGYTDIDLDQTFSPELPGLDRTEIRQWYNGYTWGGESVYNPFDLLLLFRWREFKPYWFETATPTFLIKLLGEREFFTPELSDLKTSAALLSQFDVESISTEALLFQSGYLTIHQITEEILGKHLYQLGYPNQEVATSLNEALLPALGVNQSQVIKNYARILHNLRTLNFSELHTYLKSLYASIPHDWYRKNPIANYEGHYASIFYSHFAALGLHVIVEDSCSTGRVDMTIDFNNTIFLFEFKVVADQPTGSALQQLKSNNYAEKYRHKNQPIYLIGVAFSKVQRQIVQFETEMT